MKSRPISHVERLFIPDKKHPFFTHIWVFFHTHVGLFVHMYDSILENVHTSNSASKSRKPPADLILNPVQYLRGILVYSTVIHCHKSARVVLLYSHVSHSSKSALHNFFILVHVFILIPVQY